MNKDSIFNLCDDELALAKSKNSDRNKLGFSVLLKYFQLENRYPRHIRFIDPLMLNIIANQLDISPSAISQFDWEGRSTERFRKEIREFLGYRKATNDDIIALKEWLFRNVFPNAAGKPKRVERAYNYFRENKIEPFTSGELDRHIRSAYHEFEQQLFGSIFNKLKETTKSGIDELLDDNDDDETSDSEPIDGSKIKFRHLKFDIPGPKLKNVTRAMQKIECLNQLDLPTDLFSTFSEKLTRKYYMRVMAERPNGMRGHKPQSRYAIFSIFCYYRSLLLMDSLADLFMKLTHQLQTKSENFVDKKILSEVKCINGKFDILYRLSVSAAENLTGVIQETIYPEVGQETLRNLARELYFKGKWYQTQVHMKMHSLYSHASRKMLLTLLDAFTLKTSSSESMLLMN